MSVDEQIHIPRTDQDIELSQPTARPATLFSPRIKLGVVFVLIASGLIYFAATAFGSATVEFNTVADIAVTGPSTGDRSVGVIGKLVHDSYVRSADGVTAKFALMDENGSIPMQVKYDGEIGQVFFNDHSEIILQGHMGDDRVFEAEKLTVRCPSKYQTEQERAEIEAQNNGQPLSPPYQPDYFQNGT
jgi:cytochrome c-type biogenesis protein CcmE